MPPPERGGPKPGFLIGTAEAIHLMALEMAGGRYEVVHIARRSFFKKHSYCRGHLIINYRAFVSPSL